MRGVLDPMRMFMSEALPLKVPSPTELIQNGYAALQMLSRMDFGERLLTQQTDSQLENILHFLKEEINMFRELEHSLMELGTKDLYGDVNSYKEILEKTLEKMLNVIDHHATSVANLTAATPMTTAYSAAILAVKKSNTSKLITFPDFRK
ncbi:hypothetical protein CYMTET_7218 [Cymbomonas tetramitiformis]|uniref:Uncharacterized protein n=1 Tax=Cymbomonas tetramitiformis TaxID=36881 RepID=A0AAE0BQW6_9CHLO|nr:hypothetical protein CYMTET_49158 [Cymbomonas tetramitiformis]KAK3285162.1 hypothetical protein CYMTET_7218 [Cymbomonas tetramitiformis]